MTVKFWIGNNSGIFSLWLQAQINLFRHGCTCTDMETIKNYKAVLGSMKNGWVPNKYDVQYSIFVEALSYAINY